MMAVFSVLTSLCAAAATSSLYWLAADGPEYGVGNTLVGGSPYLGLAVLGLVLRRDRDASRTVLAGTLAIGGFSVVALESYLRPFLQARQQGVEVMNYSVPFELALPAFQWFAVAVLGSLAFWTRRPLG
jgi:hypothetical protein